MTDCKQIEEYLEEYALGALDSDDKLLVDQHLKTCARCRNLLGEYTAVVEILPDALKAVSPYRLDAAAKAGLFQDIESAIGTQGELASGAEYPPLEAPLERTSAKVTLAPSIPSGNGADSVRTRPVLLRTILAFASVLLVVAVILSIRLNSVQAREQTLRSRLSQLFGQQEIVLEVIDSDQTTRRVLLPPQGDSRAYGKLFTREGMPHVVAMAARLTAPPEGQAYQLWVTTEGQSTLVGAMSVNPEGFGLLVFDADTDAPQYDAAALILQDEGMSTPSATPVLVWERPQ